MADHPSKEFQAFTSLVDKLLKVPKHTIHERVSAHRELARQNPMRPGPKPKEKLHAPARKKQR